MASSKRDSAKTGNGEQALVESKKQAKRSLDDEDVKNIAYDRLAGYLKAPYRPEAIEILAKRYERDPAQITKAVQSALEKRLVTVGVNKSTVVRVEHLEDALLEKFKGLRRAIVIRDRASSGDDSHRDPVQHPLYVDLGAAAAEFLATSEILQDSTCWAVGSGRAVHRTVSALQDFGKLRPRVSLMSLTGSFFSRPNTQSGFFLDGDVNVAHFAAAFEFDPDRQIEQKMVQNRLIYESEAEAKKVRDLTHLSEEKWLKPPSHALIGVGVMAPGHKFDPSHADQSHFKPIKADLELLGELCDRVKADDGNETVWSPVGDSSNRLMLVHNPKNIELSREQYEQIRAIKKLIDHINKKLLIVTAAQMERIDTIVLVAAQASRAPAILELLQNFKVRYLCTDEAAANRLLSMELSEWPPDLFPKDPLGPSSR